MAEKRKTSRATWLVLGLVVVGVVAAIAANRGEEKRQQAEQQRRADLTPEQRAAEDAQRAAQAAARVAQQRLETRWVATQRLIKKGLKDPDSFELLRAVTMKNGAACIEYSAKNSFNARVRGQAVTTPDDEMFTSEANAGQFKKMWMQHCAQGEVLSVAK